ncbi:MAG: VOC family protein [Synechococcales cyanobacterium]
MAIVVLHAALLVTDLEAAATFYGEILGLTPAPRALTFPGLWFQVGAVQIHLIQAATVPQGSHAKWGHHPHVALGIPDWPEVRQRLVAAGYEVQQSASGRAAFFVRDPDGNVIECSALPTP